MNQLSLLVEAESTSTPIPSVSISVDKKRKASLDFDRVVGQALAVSLLNSAIASNRIAPAYLFAGIDGIGKTLAARIFLSELLNSGNLTNHPDLLWVEPTYLHQGNLLTQSQLEASGGTRTLLPSIRVEQIREIAQFLSQSALAASRKVVIITDADRMNTTAANALLKTLEEPRNNCIILLSSQPLLPTIRSRCSIISFRPLCSADLKLVLEKLDKTDILLQPIVLTMAAGSPGMAIFNYEKWQSLPPELLGLIPPGTSDNTLEVLQVTKKIKMLEVEQQKWLLDYIQYRWWKQYQDRKLVAKVEAAKSALNKSVSPRLVWDVLLMPSNN